MATLTNVLIKNSYDALLKLTDNDPIASTPKQVTDGLGNTTQLFISDTKVGIGLSPTTQFHTNSDAKIGGNLIVVGNLEVQGTTTTIDTSTLSVEDPLIILASNNTSDASDIGFYGKYRPSSTDLYSGLFRDATDEKYHLFKDLQTEPTTTVNKSGTGYAVATLVANLEGTLTGTIASSTVATTQSQNDNSTKVATTAYVDTAIDGVDTLAEILAIGNTTGATKIEVDNTSSGIDFIDNAKARFGTGDDLEIYHDSTNTIIDNNTGDLIIRCDSDDIKILAEDDILLRDNDDSTNFIHCVNGGAVKLYHNGSEKFETTSSGVSVTGDGLISGDLGIGSTGQYASAISLNIDGSGLAIKNNVNGSNNNWSYIHNTATGSSSNLVFATGAALTALTLSHSGDATFSDRILASDGSAGSPAIAFSGDTDTGIYRTSSNAINFGTNGTERMRINNTGLGIGTNNPAQKLDVAGKMQISDDVILAQTNGRFDYDNGSSSGALRFHSTSGNAERMRITSAGRLGLGTDSPDHILCIEDSEPTLRIFDADNTLNQEQTIAFGTEPGDRTHAEIAGINLNTGNASGGLVFKTNSGSSLTEKMRLTSDGYLGINDTDPDTFLHVNAGTGQIAAKFESTDAGVFINLVDNSSGTFGGMIGAIGDDITFNPNNVELMRLDSSESRVGINTTTPSQTLHVSGNTLTSKLGVGSFNASFDLYNDGTSYFNGAVTIDADLSITESNGEINFGAGNGVIQTTTGSTSLTFGTNSTEVARCHSTGSFMINTTSVPSGDGGGAAFEKSGSLSRLKQSATSTSTIKLQVYYNANGEVGSIHTSGSATAFNTSSDYRLKDDYKDFNGLDLVSNINVYDFEWKSDKTRSYGVKAHELQEVVPQAVNGEKDGEEMQQVDYSKLVPILLKSIQELKQEIQILKSK
jgi:hypothetical protein|tara:strand:- start:159 stop:2927 length:2769 start_codon:yes stop_codon:yes gene_type:complete